jgi:hypothetical protein
MLRQPSIFGYRFETAMQAGIGAVEGLGMAGWNRRFSHQVSRRL